MIYNVLVSILINTTASVAIAFIVPRVSLTPREAWKEKMPVWIFVLGFALIAISGKELISIESSSEDSLQALLLAVSALGGVMFKWVLAILASRGRSLHERSLLNTLLFSPVSIVGYGRLFPASELLALPVFWFANGFIWQAVFDAGTRMFARKDHRRRGAADAERCSGDS